MSKKLKMGVGTGAVASLLLVGCAPSGQATPESTVTPIAWEACTRLIAQDKTLADAVGTPPTLDGWADRMECGTVEVPRDYSDPAAGTLSIEVSKLNPEESSQGVVFTNPGGPGLEARTFPAVIASTGAEDLARTHTLIGVDGRGMGGSQAVECSALTDVEAPQVDGAPTRQEALAYAAKVGEANRACVQSDPEFFENLTTANAARDLDRVRAALGADTVDYIGVSWGTELGAQFLTAFPERVNRMLLDSVVDLRHEAGASLDDIAEALTEFPVDGDTDQGGSGGSDGAGSGGDTQSAPDLLNPLSFTARTALTCNAYAGASDPAVTWAEYRARADAFPAIGSERMPHPVSSEIAGVSACADWPLAPTPMALPGSHGNLQIVSHERETVTPAGWGKWAHEQLGGHYGVLPDGTHGSLLSSDSAANAVAFIRDGVPMPE